MRDTKLHAKQHGDSTTVMILINHPMVSGVSKPAEYYNNEPAKFIVSITLTHRKRRIFNASTSGAIAENPYFELRFKGAQKGDPISLRWVDNRGNIEHASTHIT